MAAACIVAMRGANPWSPEEANIVAQQAAGNPAQVATRILSAARLSATTRLGLRGLVLPGFRGVQDTPRRKADRIPPSQVSTGRTASIAVTTASEAWVGLVQRSFCRHLLPGLAAAGDSGCFCLGGKEATTRETGLDLPVQERSSGNANGHLLLLVREAH